MFICFTYTFMILRRLSRRALLLPKLGAWALALALSAWVVASLVTRWTAPPRVSAHYVSQTEPRVVAQRLISRAPMAGEASQNAPVQSAAPSASTSRFSLVGVATGFGSAPGFALLRGPNGVVHSLMVGESPEPGITLAALYADRVEIERNGARETLPLDRRATVSPPPHPGQRNPANLR